MRWPGLGSSADNLLSVRPILFGRLGSRCWSLRTMPSHSQRPPQQKKRKNDHGTDPTGPLGVTTPGVKTHEKPAESHGNRTMTAVPNGAPVSVQDLAAALSHSVDEPERPQLSRRERRERDRNAKKAEEREEKAYRRENVFLHSFHKQRNCRSAGSIGQRIRPRTAANH